MNNDKGLRIQLILGLALAGFALGVVFVILASAAELYMRGGTFDLAAAIQLHTASLLFWLIDLLPLAGAFFGGIAGLALAGQARRRILAERAALRQRADQNALREQIRRQEQAHGELEGVLSRGKQQWEGIFDSVRDLIALTDVDGMVTRGNRALSDALRLPFDQLIGKPLAELLPGLEALGGERSQAEMRFPNLEGWYDAAATPLLVNGVAQGVIYNLRDVTDRKEAAQDVQRQRQYYELVVNNSPFPIITLSQDNSIVACNPAFVSMFGYPAREVLGEKLDALVSLSPAEDSAHAITQAVANGESVRQIAQARRADGSVIDVEVFGLPVVLWGRQIGAIAMYHDVTHLVQNAPRPEPAPLAVEPPSPPTLAKKSSPVKKIEGIGPVYAAKLAAAGILTTEDLLAAAQTRASRTALAESTGIPVRLVLDWANKADMMRVPGIGGQFSELLEAAGVDTIKDLRKRKAQSLHAALVKANDEKALGGRAPSLTEVQAWIEAAKELEPLLSY
jgi:PAS domain S-box-containing protein